MASSKRSVRPTRTTSKAARELQAAPKALRDPVYGIAGPVTQEAIAGRLGSLTLIYDRLRNLQRELGAMAPPHPGEAALGDGKLPADHPYRDWYNAESAIEGAMEKITTLAENIAARWNQQKRG